MSALRLAALLIACSGALGVAAGEPIRLSAPHQLSRDHRPGDTYMGLRLLGALALARGPVDGHDLGGLSALGFDRDEQVLYALSDRGVVFHLELDFDAAGLLVEVRARAAHALRDSRGRALEGRRADGEGMAVRNADNGVRGDAELLVSFERRPRVLRFRPDGELVGALALPRELRDVRAYRNPNRGLESLAIHPRHGPLVAPEQPLDGVDDGHAPLHALGSGLHWRYPLAAEPNAGLTDAVVLGDGSLLTLERGYGVFFVPFITTLRRVAQLPDAAGATLAPATVARLNTGQGWSLDNFEGIADLGDGRIVIVSDDNFQAVQSTLLAAFELRDTDASSLPRRNMKEFKESTAASALQ